MSSSTPTVRPSVGLIGMGEMGRMYADKLLASETCNLIVCDRPESFETLKNDYKNKENITVVQNGHLVSRACDFIMYSVEAALIDSVVAEFGPSTKIGAIVAGQTSVKAPEKAAFDKYLPSDTYVVSVHSLHSSSVDSEGQALIVIQHRAADEKVDFVKRLLAPLKSRYVDLSYDQHDLVTANTQAVTHAAFMTMGTAWRASSWFPWETGRYVRGLEVAKINITLRIFSSKWHVYAGLAILNPAARTQIDQFAQSSTDLFKLMITEDEDALRERVYEARDFVFAHETPSPLFVSDDVFDKFNVGHKSTESSVKSNSHLSLLAIVDCWHKLKIRPHTHLELAATPLFRMWFGVADYLFRDPVRLENAIVSAVWAKQFRTDDAEFVIAARGWSQCVRFGNFDWYRTRFEETAAFFEPRFEESRQQTSAMLKEILADAKS